MNNVKPRLDELRAKSDSSEFDRIERAGLFVLDREGVESCEEVINIPAESKNRWTCWAAETIVWCARQMRVGEWRAAMRGWGQLREYTGRNGGFLPYQMNDQAYAIQNCLEAHTRELEGK